MSLNRETTFASADQVLEFRKRFGLSNFADANRVFEGANLGLQIKHKSASSEQVQEFLKTFGSNAQGLTDVLDLVGGAALQIQSIDAAMVRLAQGDDAYRFLNTCHRADATSTLMEYNRLLDYGSERIPDTFVSEVSDPQFDDPILQRAVHNIAFMSSAFSSSRVLPLVGKTQDGETIIEKSAMHRIQRTKAFSIWYGNRSLRQNEFSGFEKVLVDAGSDYVYDAQGSLPDAKTIKGLTQKIRSPGWGLVNEFWMNIGTKQLYDNYFAANNTDRMLYPVVGQTGKVPIGSIIPGIADENAKNGIIEFKTDYWLHARSADTLPAKRDSVTGLFTEGPTGLNAPNPPSVTVTLSGGAVAGSVWLAGDCNGSPASYRIVARNETGRSVACAAVAGSAAITPGKAYNLVITPDNSGNPTTMFEVYRETVPGNGKFRLVERIARAATATTSYQDLNSWRPGTEIGIIGDFNSASATDEQRTYAMAYLLPTLMTKFPPGVVSLRKLGGMIEEYCGLRIFAPQKFILVKNLPVSASL